MTKPLSPAAQAVIYAWSQIGYGKDVDETFRPLLWEHKALAAALRAAADHLPDPQLSAHMLYAIADELEGSNG
jgi:hypothetical protein